MTPTPARRGDPWRPRMARWERRRFLERARRTAAPTPVVKRLRRPLVERGSIAHAFALLFPVRAAALGLPRDLWGPALEPVPALAYGSDAYRQVALLPRPRAAPVTPKSGRLAAAVVRSRAAHDAVGARLERRLRSELRRVGRHLRRR